MQPTPTGSFDHLVGAEQERGGRGNTDCPRGLKIEDELEFRGLLDRQVGWLSAARDPVDILGSPPEHPVDTWAVGQQASGIYPFAESEHGCSPVSERELGEPSAIAKEEWRCHHKQPATIIARREAAKHKIAGSDQFARLRYVSPGTKMETAYARCHSCVGGPLGPGFGLDSYAARLALEAP